MIIWNKTSYLWKEQQMKVIIIISVLIVLVVLLLSVLTINKGYSYKHTIDPVDPHPDLEKKNSDENQD
jgi:hypothetical protein